MYNKMESKKEREKGDLGSEDPRKLVKVGTNLDGVRFRRSASEHLLRVTRAVMLTR